VRTFDLPQFIFGRKVVLFDRTPADLTAGLTQAGIAAR
jgi:hypothetical protein